MYVCPQGKSKKIETLFGDAKRNLGLARLRLRGLIGAINRLAQQW